MCLNHSNRKSYIKGLCESCYKKELRRRNPEYAERQRTLQKKWVQKNRILINERKRKDYQKGKYRYSLTRKMWREKNIIKAREYCRKYQFRRRLRELGITEQEYVELFNKQQGRCGICKVSHQKLCLDHNHGNKKARGLLCLKCNFLIGYARENISILTRAINYLHKHNGTRSRDA